MFSTKVFAALLAVSASAMAAPGLSLKVSGVDAAEGVENLKVTATLTNTGDSTLKLLNDPRTVSPVTSMPVECALMYLFSGSLEDSHQQLLHLI